MLDQTSMKAAVDELVASDPGVRAAVVISYDGLVMISSLDDRDRSEATAAIASEIIGKARLAVNELDHGELGGAIVFGETGGSILRMINEEIGLICEVGPAVNVGRLYGLMGRICTRLNAG